MKASNVLQGKHLLSATCRPACWPPCLDPIVCSRPASFRRRWIHPTRPIGSLFEFKMFYLLPDELQEQIVYVAARCLRDCERRACAILALHKAKQTSTSNCLMIFLMLLESPGQTCWHWSTSAWCTGPGAGLSAAGSRTPPARWPADGGAASSLPGARVSRSARCRDPPRCAGGGSPKTSSMPAPACFT